MKACWRSMLRKSLQPTSLHAVRYAVFGLGDSGYVQFNVVAKKLDRRLAQLGAQRLLEVGLGDDQVLTVHL
jgi:sulfite reductase alpha subunit-like flavoprotein